MKLKLSIFTFTAILSVFYLQIVSCKGIEGQYDPEDKPIIDRLEGDYEGPHFTNEIATITCKTTFNYYNSWKYRNKPEQERIRFWIKTDKEDSHLRPANCRRILESPILDIYVDLSEHRDIVKKSVNFGINNWIKLLNSFYDNYQKMIDVYGNHYKGFNGGKIDILFTDLIKYKNGSRMNGYFAQRDIDDRIKSAGINYGNKRQILYLTSSFLDEKNIDDMMHTIFHEFQHLINYSWYLNYPSRKPMELWLNEALSESTYYIIHGNTPNKNRFNSYRNSQQIKNGASFYTWIYKSTDSYVTASMFMYWLYLHGGGEKIINNIAYYDRKEMDNYKIIEIAIKNNFPYQYKSHLPNWENILASWYSANFSRSSLGVNSGLESYLGNYIFNPQILTQVGQLKLAPGEGIYIDPSKINIKYSSSDIIQKKLYDINRSAILVFNKSLNNTNIVYFHNKSGIKPMLIKRIPYMDPNVWIDEVDEN